MYAFKPKLLGDVLGEIMVEKNKSRTSVSQYFPFIGLRAVLHAITLLKQTQFLESLSVQHHTVSGDVPNPTISS